MQIGQTLPLARADHATPPILRIESYAAARARMAQPAPAPASEASRLRIALGGNCSMEFMVPGLVNGLRDLGIATEIRLLPFDGWIAAILNGEIDVDLCIIWLSTLGISQGGSARGSLPLDGVTAALDALAARGTGAILLLPEALDSEIDPFSPFCGWRQYLIEQMLACIPPSVIKLRTDALQRDLRHPWHAPRYWSSAKCPCHPDAMTAIGSFLASVVVRSLKPQIRAVVVDLDNTLWGGVVGEDGVDGIDLDVHGAGRPYIRMQGFLKDLAEKGVPICVASKNVDEDAREPFRKRPEMILKLEDFVHFYANWERKADAIQRIAADLSLTPDTICFLDDSPVERGLTRSLVPGLVVPELPDDPDEWIGFLAASGLFLQPIVSAVDRERVAFYKSDAQRRSAQDAVRNPDAYMRSLEMTLTAWRVAPANAPRVVSLIHKTNQFNMTTARLSPSEVDDIARTPGNYAYCFDYADRFGAGGIIGVLLGTRIEARLTIAVFLLSCRVLNRGVEDAVLAHLLHWCRETGVAEIVGIYLPTAKNGLAAEFYPRHGFAPLPGGNGHFLLSVATAESPGHHLTVATRAEPE
jgi:FkbH-like protein